MEIAIVVTVFLAFIGFREWLSAGREKIQAEIQVKREEKLHEQIRDLGYKAYSKNYQEYLMLKETDKPVPEPEEEDPGAELQDAFSVDAAEIARGKKDE